MGAARHEALGVRVRVLNELRVHVPVTGSGLDLVERGIGELRSAAESEGVDVIELRGGGIEVEHD